MEMLLFHGTLLWGCMHFELVLTKPMQSLVPTLFYFSQKNKKERGHSWAFPLKETLPTFQFIELK